jgi:hypothetical protein
MMSGLGKGKRNFPTQLCLFPSEVASGPERLGITQAKCFHSRAVARLVRAAFAIERRSGMVPYKYLLAAALLTSSPDAPLPETNAELYASIQPPLQALAIEWELLDPREARYVLARPEDLTADLNLLRRRCHDLRDAPPASDAVRFPERAAVNELLAFNRAFKQFVEVRQPGEPGRSPELREAVTEIDHLYHVWDTVRDARCEYYYVTVRRQALKRLREMLGEEAYYSAKLPPHVPVWRCQEIR